MLWWLRDNGFIRKMVVSIYLGVYDGTDDALDILKKQKDLGLPPPNV